MNTPLLIGTDGDDLRMLAAALRAEVLALPKPAEPMPGAPWAWSDELESWRADHSTGPPYGRIVVAAWPGSFRATAAVELDAAGWEGRTEQPLARWVVALGCAVSRCAQGGSVVAVVDGPTSLESPGWAPETAVAEAVSALCRSLALSEGARGVRVNTVSTPARLPLGEPVHPLPPLPTFPGHLEREVAGAVRLLLSDDACGVTGTTVHADAGRAWR